MSHKVLKLSASLLFVIHLFFSLALKAQLVCPQGTGSNLVSSTFYDRAEGTRSDIFSSPLNTTSSSYKIAYPKGHIKRPVNTGSDSSYVQNLINTLDDYGAIYFFKGDYYLNNIKLRKGLTLVAQSGTRFMGTSGHLTGWTQHTSNIWAFPYSGIKTFYNINSNGVNTYRCEDRNSSTCLCLQDLFINGQWLRQVNNIAELDQTNEWYFDETQHLLLLYSTVDPDNLNANIELSISDRAFFYDPNNMRASSHIFPDVNIHNIIFQGYNFQALVTGKKWAIKNCEFKNNHLAGINVKGDSTFIKNNIFRYNGCTGITCNLDKYAEIRDNEICWNNQAMYDGAWHAGGLKASGSTNLTLAGNYVHHNRSVGLWVDNMNKKATVCNNWLEDNVIAIQYEVSDSGKIYNNTFKNNESYAIYAMCSPNLEISRNTIDGTKNGIVIRQDNRSNTGNCITNPGLPQCKYQVRNIYAHHNNIKVYRHDDFVTGFIILHCSTSACGTWQRFFSKEYNVLFDYNRYQYVRLDQTKPLNRDKAFYWNLDPVSLKSVAQNFEFWSSLHTDFHDKHSCIEEHLASSSVTPEKLSSETASLNEEVQLFPVPFTDKLAVQSSCNPDETQIYFTNYQNQRFDILARNMQRERNRIILDTQELPPGIYILHVSCNNNNSIKRRVVKH